MMDAKAAGEKTRKHRQNMLDQFNIVIGRAITSASSKGNDSVEVEKKANMSFHPHDSFPERVSDQCVDAAIANLRELGYTVIHGTSGKLKIMWEV